MCFSVGPGLQSRVLHADLVIHELRYLYRTRFHVMVCRICKSDT